MMSAYLVERRYNNPSSGWTSWEPCVYSGLFYTLSDASREAYRKTKDREEYRAKEYVSK
jgi:hypothetical protein